MKKVRSILKIFMVFLIMITAGFLILYCYSSVSLKESLIQTTRLQMKYSRSLLTQKIKEIEIEADGILNSDIMRMLSIAIEEDDVYQYVMSVNRMKEFLGQRQKSNVGMGQFVLYWPEAERIIATVSLDHIKEDVLIRAEDNRWIISENEVYFIRKCLTDWDTAEEEPYLIIQMDRDFLYNIKSMASGVEHGSALLVTEKNRSIFPASEKEKTLLSLIREHIQEDEVGEQSVEGELYQVIRSGEVRNGLELVCYYPLQQMLEPVGTITRITGILLMILLAIGFILMSLYYKNILLELNILTLKLRQVEKGDFTAKIEEVPDNEFAYVFSQFNQMVERIRNLLETTIKEQTLRSQAELRQLQMQIHPHFLYNSLSYIVTVADQPEAVIRMAVHLSDYYRYCTKNKTMATVHEEVAYARAYLEIMAMRKEIEYSIETDPETERKQVLPLILQPVIENAIEHGIEARENAKHIYVKIFQKRDGRIDFEISDDGNGMSGEEIRQLSERIEKKERDEEESVGLWNVNQRLVNFYDRSSRLKFERSIWGGLKVSFTIGNHGKDYAETEKIFLTENMNAVSGKEGENYRGGNGDESSDCRR